ncbi:hypothetical protein Q7306_10895 [Glaesserella parasuis]|uniref:hypothetical protein n=1 Tax=Glaesserella parasuis TaxID=738 RepID=UPI001365D7DA|nr:hypothetical protein [Glaesserella parasuis]MDP0233314.1 hypothetical protein [Glaesserella parasuis]MDP0241644.1 hypothetical protein [Glaesserella parasuis]MDP0322933.1 hypothetical protein [Glaesserella parasuis]MDP0325096.1 hypothetical protein [Glaesserella parasuis]MWQ31688.1 hypothetical protein [Glaesserella parasuis]
MKTLIKKLNLKYLLGALLIAFVTGGSLTGCEEPELVSSLPVESNFQAEKIWTEDDFKQAEIAPEEVNYNALSLHLPPPDNVTGEDVKLIKQHNQNQLNKLIVGAKR